MGQTLSSLNKADSRGQSKLCRFTQGSLKKADSQEIRKNENTHMIVLLN